MQRPPLALDTSSKGLKNRPRGSSSASNSATRSSFSAAPAVPSNIPYGSQGRETSPQMSRQSTAAGVRVSSSSMSRTPSMGPTSTTTSPKQARQTLLQTPVTPAVPKTNYGTSTKTGSQRPSQPVSPQQGRSSSTSSPMPDPNSRSQQQVPAVQPPVNQAQRSTPSFFERSPMRSSQQPSSSASHTAPPLIRGAADSNRQPLTEAEARMRQQRPGQLELSKK